MKSEVGKFTFKIPDTHAEAGKKIEKAFEFDVCESESEASDVIAKKTADGKKGWSLTEMVNETLKANARSNAYQAALLPYRPSEVSAEEIQERIVRDLIRIGIPEAMARAQVSGAVAAVESAEGK